MANLNETIRIQANLLGFEFRFGFEFAFKFAFGIICSTSPQIVSSKHRKATGIDINASFHFFPIKI